MNAILWGDCREMLKTLPAGSVQTCVTSPPYFGLRDYGHGEQIGLEPTPDEFVAAICAVFDEIWRVLKDDGTAWLNLGDSYWNAKGDPCGEDPKQKARRGFKRVVDGPPPPGIKRKDLIGIPWMVAFALRSRGWYLRQEIIWAKPNPMPESVRDRCTKAHESLFLLTKNERYYFDSDAIKEPVQSDRAPSRKAKRGGAGRKELRTQTSPYDGTETHRNRRDVWTIATRPYKGAHFATFPPALIEPCILAGSRPGDIVLDPFGGSGTTGAVARQLGRQFILCELNLDYIDLAYRRIYGES